MVWKHSSITGHLPVTPASNGLCEPGRRPITRARAAVEAVDAERIRYLRKLLVDAGVATTALPEHAHA